MCTCVYDSGKDFVSVSDFELFGFFLFALAYAPNDSGVTGEACRRYGNTEEAECEFFCEGASAHLGGESV